MAGLIFQFVLLAVLIVAAGTLLAHTADRIGKLTGLGGTLAGFLLLAGATSLPELAIDCKAATIGAPDLAVGDLLGSSIFNLLILGVIDLTHRSTVRILSPVSAAHALSAITSIVLTALALVSMVLPYNAEFIGIGIGPWLILITYFLSVRLIFFDQRVAHRSHPQTRESTSRTSLSRNVYGFAVGALVVLTCGPLLARVADGLAEETGLGGTLVGTTFVALTTSLPEIITTITAVRMGAYELAAGNIFGSNCFNMAILPIVDFFYREGPIMRAVEMTHALTACSVIVITGLATMGLLYRVEKRIWLFEPDALLVVLLSTVALVVLMFVNGL